MPLLQFLYDRLAQLRDRKDMIPRYVARPGGFAGKKKDFSLNDLPKIQWEMAETEAAIKAVEEYRKQNKKPDHAKSKQG